MTNTRPMSSTVDTDALGSSATSEAHRKILAGQRTAATWVLACNATSAQDFAQLCEALDLDTGRAALTAVRKTHGKRRRGRKGGSEAPAAGECDYSENDRACHEPGIHELQMDGRALRLCKRHAEPRFWPPDLRRKLPGGPLHRAVTRLAGGR